MKIIKPDEQMAKCMLPLTQNLFQLIIPCTFIIAHKSLNALIVNYEAECPIIQLQREVMDTARRKLFRIKLCDVPIN